MEQLSPMMQQYMAIKEQNKDSILFFRLGDFYEMFFEDAEIASKELELTLTGKVCGMAERAPMCGVPYHSAESYIARLIAKGYKVAICEQTEEVTKGKKLVDREIVRIVTPGTVIENTMLDETRNNYICAIYREGDNVGISFMDISTGEAFCTELSGEDSAEQTIEEVVKFSPSEAIINGEFWNDAFSRDYIRGNLGVNSEKGNADIYEYENAKQRIFSHFGTENPEEIGLVSKGVSVNATGALLAYLHDTQKTSLSHINKIEFYSREQYMILDETARRNLEISETMRSKEKRGSLLWAIDKTKTSMGSRLLRSWLEKPLISVSEINNRLDAVAELVAEPMTREEMREAMSAVRDIERLLGRVVYGAANGRDLIAMAKTFEAIPAIKEKISKFTSPLLVSLCAKTDGLSDMEKLISDAICDEPPFSIREGGIIREGYSEEVEKLRDMLKNGSTYIAELTAKEREATGIKNLKIAYNRVFGYYIEVTKSNLADVPDRYIRKQTLANAERYITEELKELETMILGAKEMVC
ncbi:MAG: DNA mismatch repair protein MutS, partial [Ruminococcaceae bacterium]|nr:DNA mismatch repair protein MutS [Oscillospiraceae bacterium]